MSMDGIHYVGTMEFVKKDDLDKAIKDMHENAKVFLDYYSEKGVKNEFSD